MDLQPQPTHPRRHADEGAPTALREEHLLITSKINTPILTPMFYHFADVECNAAQTHFMFGTAYLAAPVYVYQATNRMIYLPRLLSKETWVHVYSTVMTWRSRQP